jgi:hypothetical protein
VADQSHLDNRYFIDQNVYNCPFCNRRNVIYGLLYKVEFDWTENKKCYIYVARCFSCAKTSIHFSYKNMQMNFYSSAGETSYYHFTSKDLLSIDNLDDIFFFSIPKSFFVLDERIPKVLRELIAEAEGCLKSNFLTGASACTRKVIYELGVMQNATGANYEERIKSLKEINKGIDPAYFDTLLTIQQVTSTKVHEKSYDGWEAKHLKLILTALSEVLNEIFVIPEIRKERRQALLNLKNEIIPAQKAEPIVKKSS